MTTTTQPTSQLTLKWITHYFKRSGMEVQVSRFSHVDGSETLLLKNNFLLVHTPMHPDLLPYTIAEWQHATFPAGGKGLAEESHYDLSTGWYHFEGMAFPIRLEVTPELYEVPGSDRKKPGTFYRRLRRPDGGITYLQKAFCDFLSPDLDELEGFLFEQIDNPFTPIRVSAANGHVVYLMPADVKRR